MDFVDQLDAEIPNAPTCRECGELITNKAGICGWCWDHNINWRAYAKEADIDQLVDRFYAKRPRIHISRTRH